MEYYTPLLYTCGYSFSLLPNLILVIILFGLIALIWMLIWATDLLLRYVCKKKTDQPRLTNIAIRFLYEVYFEICLSVMIFVSFMDFNDSSSSNGGHLEASIICLILIVVAFLALVAITLLFWRNGPSVKGSFEHKSLWKSFWGYRPIRKEILDQVEREEEE